MSLKEIKWKYKLIPNSIKYLRKCSEEFPAYLEKIRKAEPPELLKRLQKEQLDWLPFYTPITQTDFEKIVPKLIDTVTTGKRPTETMIFARSGPRGSLTFSL